MKNAAYHRKERGVSLLEALVAFAILAFGVAGTLRLNTVLIRETAETRDRLQALSIANRTVSDLRTANNQTQFDQLLTSQAATAFPITGDNRTTYQRSITFNGNVATVTVAWNNRFGQTSNVTLSTRVAFINPAVIAGSGTESSVSNFNRFVRPPTGNATTQPGGGTATTIPLSDMPEGSELRRLNTIASQYGLTLGRIGANFALINNGKTVLRSTNGDSFSSISGRLYVDKRQYPTTSSLPRNAFYIVVSDASFCALNPPRDDTNSYTDNPAAQYFQIEYTCFVGSDWYGRIGIIRIDNANVNERVCVGDPRVNQILPFNREYPSLSTVREYRGFDTGTYTGPNSFYETFGIGYANSNRTTYNPMHYIGHHFYLSRIQGGNPTNTDCATAMALASPSPYNPPAARTSPYAPVNNPDTFSPGRYFCFPNNFYGTGAGVQTCPYLFPSEGNTNLTLEIRTNEGSSSPIQAVSLDGQSCPITTNNNNNRTFRCTYNLVSGFAGATWTALPLQVSTNSASGVLNVCINSFTGLTLNGGTFQPVQSTPNNWSISLAGSITALDASMLISSTTGSCPSS